MARYDTEQLFLESATDLKAQITQVDLVISGLISAAIAATSDQDLEEYSLDDGQTKIKIRSRTPAQLSVAVMQWKVIKQMLVNQVNGRAVRLMDSKSVEHDG